MIDATVLLDALLLVLLIVAVAVGALVLRALRRLQRSGGELGGAIASLDRATRAAHDAVGALKTTTADAAAAAARLEPARELANELDALTGITAPLLDRLETASGEALAAARRLEGETGRIAAGVAR